MLTDDSGRSTTPHEGKRRDFLKHVGLGAAAAAAVAHKAEQRVITKKIFDREHDQVLRMWMPYDGGFLLFQPHLRNIGALAMRRTDGYGASTVARIWSEK